MTVMVLKAVFVKFPALTAITLTTVTLAAVTLLPKQVSRWGKFVIR
jgi:hypothetical protein